MWDKTLLKELLTDILPKFKDEAVKINNDMAANPELGSQEYKSSQKIVDSLRSHGLEVEYPFAGLETAFRCSVNKGKEKKMVLLSEYDALPEIGHACGHCASGVASMWAFLALAKVAKKLDAQIDLIGTPDEEVEGSKCLMAENGIFDKYDFAAMCHMGGQSTLEVDFIALEGIIFEFYGKAAHAAQAPELGKNALNAGRLFLDAVDMMRQHIIPTARLHGYIENGGVAANIVPDYVCVKYMVRAPKRKDMEYISTWVKECAHAAALATRTKVEILKYGDVFYDLHVSKLQHDIMELSFDELGLDLVKEKGKFVGSSDIGNVSYHCPAFHPIVGIYRPDLNLHTKEMAEAMNEEKTHQGMEDAAKVLLQLAFEIYGTEGKLEEIKEDFKLYRK